ncbi:MAG: GGDEF domain-containing protein [Pseudomonadota bacterium]
MKDRVIIFFVVVFILCLTALLFLQVRVNDYEHSRNAFSQQMTQSLEKIEAHSFNTREELKQWQNQRSKEKKYSLEHFKSKIKQLKQAHPEFDVVMWNEVVPFERRADVERQIGAPFVHFSVNGQDLEQLKGAGVASLFVALLQPSQGLETQKSGQKTLYLPVMAVEPEESMSRLMGFDFFSLSQLGFKLNFEDIVRQTQLSSFPMIQTDIGEGEDRFMNIVLPIFDFEFDEPNRRADVVLKGLTTASLSIKRFFNDYGMEEFGNSHITVTDITDSQKQDNDGVLIYETGDRELSITQQSINSIIEVFGRKLKVTAEASPEYIVSTRNNTLAYSVLVGGALLSVSYLLLVLRLHRVRRDRVDDVVRERTSKLTQDNQMLSIENQELEYLMRVDALTDIHNRRSFDEVSVKEWARASREQTSLVIFMIDVDHFKPYNDEYGHVKGDETLYQVAQCIKSVCSRSSDLVARYGGEEFAVILPNTEYHALRVAERCRAAVAALKIEHKHSPTSDRVTISLGMSSVIPRKDTSLEDLINSADRALYLAKTQGRNRVIFNACVSDSLGLSIDSNETKGA